MQYSNLLCSDVRHVGNNPLVVSLANLADLQARKRSDGDRIWLEFKQKAMN